MRTARPNAQTKVEYLGLTFHTLEGAPYWFEEAAYEFSESEILELESASNLLHELCLHAVDHVIRHRDFARFQIPEAAWPVIEQAWEDDPPAIYGRFDLAYDGVHPPKLLEYNADTPTSLLEAAVIQWHWLQEVMPTADQFNSIWEHLIQKWRDLKSEGCFPQGTVHFASMDCDEDLMTTAVMMDTAQEVGLKVVRLLMTEIQWDEDRRQFLDADLDPIRTLFKLYPWEWMVREPFGTHALETYRQVQWIEPIWKMILSNKVILAVLWELFPDHPNLLPAFQDSPQALESYVRKPILGREGANISIHSPTLNEQVDGPYTGDGFVYQALATVPEFDGNHAIIGSWIVDGNACGIGVRESDRPITRDTARFVPHFFLPQNHEHPNH